MRSNQTCARFASLRDVNLIVSPCAQHDGAVRVAVVAGRVVAAARGGRGGRGRRFGRRGARGAAAGGAGAAAARRRAVRRAAARARRARQRALRRRARAPRRAGRLLALLPRHVHAVRREHSAHHHYPGPHSMSVAGH